MQIIKKKKQNKTKTKNKKQKQKQKQAGINTYTNPKNLKPPTVPLTYIQFIRFPCAHYTPKLPPHYSSSIPSPS